jgi:hypothetical protein
VVTDFHHPTDWNHHQSLPGTALPGTDGTTPRPCQGQTEQPLLPQTTRRSSTVGKPGDTENLVTWFRLSARRQLRVEGPIPSTRTEIGER